MTTSTGNPFVGTAGAELSTTPGWHYISGSANVQIDADGVGAYPISAAIGRYWNDTFISAADPDSATLAFDIRAGAGDFQIGPVVGAQANGDGYLFTYSGPASSGIPNSFALYRYNGTSILPLNGNFGTLALAVGSHTIKIERVVGPSSVTLNCYVDGAASPNWTFTDSTANRITARGYRGLWAYGASTPTTGVMMTSITGADSAGAVQPAFAFTGPSALNGHVIQSAAPIKSKSPMTNVQRTGTYTGSPASIQSRVLVVATGQPLPGFDWATRVASPSGGAFSYTLANMPAGSWLTEELRDSANPGAVTSSGIWFGVGELTADYGQSNNEVLSIAGTGTPHPNLRVFDTYRNPGQWTSPTVGAGNILKGNALVDALGGDIVVGLIQLSMSGAGLAAGAGLGTPTSGGVPRDWSPNGVSTTQAPSPRVRAVTAFAVLGQRPRTATWVQGESDAMTGVGVASYQANLAEIFAFIRTQCAPDAKIHCALLGQTNDVMSSAANWDAVRQAQIAAVAADGNATTMSKQDLVCDANSPDMTTASYVVWGPRIAQKIIRHWGLASYGNGPRITGVTALSSILYEITLAHDGGTDITPAGANAITDIQIKDGSTIVLPTDISRYVANKIRFTLASAPTGPVSVQSCYGKSSAPAGIVHDNTALALPLMASAPVASGAALATTATFTVTDAATGQPLNATGLDYAFFDQAKPSLKLAPVKKGANLAVVNGTCTLDLTGVTALPVGGIGSIEWTTADGTTGGGGSVVVS